MSETNIENEEGYKPEKGLSVAVVIIKFMIVIFTLSYFAYDFIHEKTVLALAYA